MAGGGVVMGRRLGHGMATAKLRWRVEGKCWGQAGRGGGEGGKGGGRAWEGVVGMGAG